ncbi:hypothetical protein K502DRAFT_352776 [Neoconidiobolus thromboides FSU 785]|nr:hypothetical protein K502DRAFT_352776 [Neoconidiobolus thromboides FSU 785]
MFIKGADSICNCASNSSTFNDRIELYPMFSSLYKILSEVSPHLNNINIIECFEYETIDTDIHLINHYYFINNNDITSSLCKHDLEFLKQNSTVPFYKLPLLIVCSLTLCHLPTLNLYHLLPIYLTRIKDLLDQIIALSNHIKLTFTNHYYINLSNLLCSFILPYIR